MTAVYRFYCSIAFIWSNLKSDKLCVLCVCPKIETVNNFSARYLSQSVRIYLSTIFCTARCAIPVIHLYLELVVRELNRRLNTWMNRYFGWVSTRALPIDLEYFSCVCVRVFVTFVGFFWHVQNVVCGIVFWNDELIFFWNNKNWRRFNVHIWIKVIYFL